MFRKIRRALPGPPRRPRTGGFSRAEETATKAFDTGGEQRFIRIDALIARGEARLGLKKIEEACEDFNRVLADGIDNRKVQALAHLYLARAYIDKGDRRLALRHRNEATRSLEQIDNAFIQDLAKKLDGLLEQSEKDFFISSSASEIDPRQFEKEFHGFLTEWAKHQPDFEHEP